MEDRILTLHPEGKQGVNISKQKYNTMRQAILDCLSQYKELTYSQLADAVEEKLDGRFDGSIRWYFTTVKLDLEARHLLQRSSTKPQRIRLAPDVQD
ncbi:MAG: hypothetical protein BMS9Abin02_0572 [Anaerolineae bacterium]|nr:MAG: hypothetical protein BMS9Abin02_0572 [Anaerolineae bacterium]